MSSTTFYQLVVDASGSMSGSEASTVSSMNEQIALVRRLSAEHTDEQFSLGIVDFSSDLRVLREMSPIDKIEDVAMNEYTVRDCTALYDALGSTVARMESAHLERKDNGEDSFVVVVITDGAENASDHYNLNTLKSLLNRLEKNGKWEFRFIGADFLTDDFTAQLGLKNAKSYYVDKAAMSQASQYMDEEMRTLIRKKKGIV